MVCTTALVAGGAVALAVADGGGQPRTGVSERTGAGKVALVPSHNAGVGGWCVAGLGGPSKEPEESKDGECTASDRATEGPVPGPIVAESGNQNQIVMLGSHNQWVKRVIALVTARVAAVSFKGHRRVATHASALLPDHLRGAIVELRGPSTTPPTFPRFPQGHLIAWSSSGKPVPQTFAQEPPFAFEMPVRSWSNGAPPPRGVCAISVRDFAEHAFRNGGVMTAVRPHTDVRGREFVNCAHSYYLLHEAWPIEANVLLDAEHPGATPAPLPGMRPLAGHAESSSDPAPKAENSRGASPAHGWSSRKAKAYHSV